MRFQKIKILFPVADKDDHIPEAPPAPVISQSAGDDDYDDDEEHEFSHKSSKEGKMTKVSIAFASQI